MNQLISWLGFIVTVATILYLGWQLAVLIKTRSVLERIGLSIILGPLFATILFMGVYQVTGLFSIGLFLLTLILSVTVLLIHNRGKASIATDLRYIASLLKQYSLLSVKVRLLFTLVAAYVGITGWINASWPITDWDSIALYDFRAQVLAVEHSWKTGTALGYFFHYPPYTSLLHGITYLFGVTQSKLWYSLMLVGTLVLFYSLLRRNVSRKLSALGVFLLVIAPIFSEHVLVAYTNMPYSILLSFAVLYCALWLKEQNSHEMVVCLILLGGASWIRQAEPFWLVPLALIVGRSIWKHRLHKMHILLSACLLFIGLQQYWPAYVRGLQLPPVVAGVTDSSSSRALPAFTLGNVIRNSFLVLDYLYQFLLEPQLLLIALVVIAGLYDTELRKQTQALTVVALSVVFMLMILAGTFYFSFTYLTWELIGGSVTRMSMFLVPLFVFFIAHSQFWKPIIGSDSARETTPKD